MRYRPVASVWAIETRIGVPGAWRMTTPVKPGGIGGAAWGVPNEGGNAPPAKNPDTEELPLVRRPVGTATTDNPTAGAPSGKRITPESAPVDPGGSPRLRIPPPGFAGTNREKSTLSTTAPAVIEITCAAPM